MNRDDILLGHTLQASASASARDAVRARVLAVVLAVFAVLAPPLPASAQGLAPVTAPEPYDPRQLGSALGDVDHPKAAAAAAYLASTPDLDLGHVLSASLRSLTPTHILVDVVSLHPRFVQLYPDAGRPYLFQGRRPPRRPPGGVGLTRLALAITPGLHVVKSHVVLSAHALSDLDLTMRVSVGDALAVVEDRALHFRRIYPLGVGAVDRVRRLGEVSSITPTTRFGRLDKRRSWEVMRFPKYFRDLPYIPLNIPVPRATEDPEAESGVRLVYRPTWIAFHIWQQPRFARGFLSHGCIRMRGEDLSELAAFVYGVEETIPVHIVAEPLADVRHSHWRLTDRYFELRNVGTATKPRPWIVMGVWVTDYVRGAPVPAPEDFVGITIDSPALQRHYDTHLDPTWRRPE